MVKIAYRSNISPKLFKYRKRIFLGLWIFLGVPIMFLLFSRFSDVEGIYTFLASGLFGGMLAYGIWMMIFIESND